jgi:steroid delta-isomerase-like uncharacterized protein
MTNATGPHTANIETFYRIVEEGFSGDLAAFDDTVADDIVVHTPVGPFEGREALRGYIENTFEAIPDYTVTIEDGFGDGDLVAGRFIQSGRQTGAAAEMGLPATGNRFEMSGALFARFEDGRCVEMWSIWDKMEFLQQLELFPDSPGKIVGLLVRQLKSRLASQ